MMFRPWLLIAVAAATGSLPWNRWQLVDRFEQCDAKDATTCSNLFDLAEGLL